jgi:hypothetical protein
MIKNKKWFSNLIPLSHKEYVTFGDDKKGKVLGTGVIKVNDHFTLNDVTLVNRLRYNLLSVSRLVEADLHVLFQKSDSEFLTQLTIWFVVFFRMEMFFRHISHLLSLP